MTVKFIWNLSRRSLRLGLALSLLLPGLAQAQSGEPIKIGFITERTGSWSYFGTACTQGMQVAERAINASGGVLGRPLSFIVTDDQTNPGVAIADARRLDTRDNVVAFSGSMNSDSVLAIYGYAEQNKIPLIVTAGTTQVTKPGSHDAFRLYPDVVGWGYAVARFIESRNPKAKVALLYSDFSVMRNIVAGLKFEAKKSGLNIVSDAMFPQAANDATVQAAQAMAAKPDYFMVLGAGALDATITNQLLDLGVKPEQIIHPYGTTSVIIAWSPRSVGSVYGTPFDVNMDDITPTGRKFINDFTHEVGRVPGYSEYFCNLQAYILKAAIERAGSADRTKIRDAISALKMTDPLTGAAVEFDKNGARRKESLSFMEVQAVGKRDYKAKKLVEIQWSPEVIPVYELAK